MFRPIRKIHVIGSTFFLMLFIVPLMARTLHAGPAITDCNQNGIEDAEDIAQGTSLDCNSNNQPDECDIGGAGGTVDQWASWVIDFSSQYSSGDWSAQQTLGPPDTFDYGDYATAWTSANYNGTLEFVTVGFDMPVFSDGVTVRETYGNGFVYQVDLIDLDQDVHTVWAGIDSSLPESPVDFRIDWPRTDYVVIGVTIHVDTGHDMNAWEEIDAIQHHGAQVISFDCNTNAIPDECDIGGGTSTDLNANDRPDDCDPDCNYNGLPDDYELETGTPDVNYNGLPDDCDPDCNNNDIPDEIDVAPPVAMGINRIPDEFEPAGTLDWSTACDDCDSGIVSLPFPILLQGETFVSFVQSSNGYVELLRSTDSASGASYGPVAELVEGPQANTFLLAAYDDLDSSFGGQFGYRFEADRVVFHWYTETYCDDDDGIYNEFEVSIDGDGRVQWNIAQADYSCHNYNLFSGLYLGQPHFRLFAAASESMPPHTSYEFTGDPLPGRQSADIDYNGIPDECDPDCNSNGTLDSLDILGAVPPGFTEVPFAFEVPGFHWIDSDDDSASGVVPLPFAVTLGAENYIAAQQNSNGHIELLRTGDTPYNQSYSAIGDLISYDGGIGGPTHTYLLAAFDDLTSYYFGYYGYRLAGDRVEFVWRTETYCDDEDYLLNDFKITVFPDGTVRYDFGQAHYACHGYDLFSGVYLGYGEEYLYELVSYDIPEYASWIFRATEFVGGDSTDQNANGVPDECDAGQCDDDGDIDLDDYAAIDPCLTGPPSGGIPVDCQCLDSDFDDDVDLKDVAAVCNNMTIPVP
ncbi:MAG: hypothetical protein ACYTHJ_17025 [Planctomycetota bacterium]|jgi:hypothetical protein